MSKIKILYIHHAAGWGGAPINMINIIEGLDTNKFAPHVLLLKDSIVKDRLKEKKIPYTICNHFFYKKYYTYFTHSDASFISPLKIFKLATMMLSWILSRFFYSKQVLKNFDVDIVHLNSSVLSDWLYASKKIGKVVYHVQEPLSKGWFGLRLGFIRKQVNRFADMVFAISEDNAKRINLSHKTIVVYNFAFIPFQIPKFNNFNTILYVGGGAKIKGIDLLLEAIPYINTEIEIKLVGDFPHLKKLPEWKLIAYKILYPYNYNLRCQLIKVLNSYNVTLVGSLNSIDDPLSESCVLISPFTVPHFSRPIIEAFANGRPVIATNVEGMDEIVNHFNNGLLLKEINPLELATSINLLCSSPKLIIELGLNGRAKAELLYSATVNIRKIEETYTSLVNGIERSNCIS